MKRCYNAILDVKVNKVIDGLADPSKMARPSSMGRRKLHRSYRYILFYLWNVYEISVSDKQKVFLTVPTSTIIRGTRF